MNGERSRLSLEGQAAFCFQDRRALPGVYKNLPGVGFQQRGNSGIILLARAAFPWERKTGPFHPEGSGRPRNPVLAGDEGGRGIRPGGRDGGAPFRRSGIETAQFGKNRRTGERPRSPVLRVRALPCRPPAGWPRRCGPGQRSAPAFPAGRRKRCCVQRSGSRASGPAPGASG